MSKPFLHKLAIEREPLETVEGIRAMPQPVSDKRESDGH
jgi:hypothetical protein